MNLPQSAAIGLDTPYTITAEHIATYRRDGCIRLREVMPAAILAQFQPTFRRLVDERTRNQKPLAERSTYDKAFQQVMNLWCEDEQAKAFVFSQRLARIAAELMETDGVRLYHDQALFKEAGGGPTPWHVDQYYWPLDTTKTITAWIPLQATRPDMGPLEFSLGSHRLDLGRDLEISDESERKIGERLRLTDLPKLEGGFDLGEVSFHAGWCFHRAPGNLTDRPREVMTMIYFADGTRMSKPRNRGQENDWRDHLPGAVIGEPIATALNPLLYKRA
jgi:ectoine hydroxylase-related dioxygenase (phytanoyl-CoA dioxygenase family)